MLRVLECGLYLALRGDIGRLVRGSNWGGEGNDSLRLDGRGFATHVVSAKEVNADMIVLTSG